MKIAANIGSTFRLVNVVLGLACIGAVFAVPLEGWLRIAAPIFGIAGIAAGATGW